MTSLFCGDFKTFRAVVLGSLWVFLSLVLFTANEKLLYQTENRSLTQPLLNLLPQETPSLFSPNVFVFCVCDFIQFRTDWCT